MLLLLHGCFLYWEWCYLLNFINMHDKMSAAVKSVEQLGDKEAAMIEIIEIGC